MWWGACQCCQTILNFWWNGGSKPYPHNPGTLVYFPNSTPANFLTAGGAFDVNNAATDETVAVAGTGVFPATGLVSNDETTPIPAKFNFPFLHTTNPAEYGGIFTDEQRNVVAVAANPQGGYFAGAIRQYWTRTGTDNNGNGAQTSIAVTRLQAGDYPKQLVIPIQSYPWANQWTIQWAAPDDNFVSSEPIQWNATAAQVQTAIQSVSEMSTCTVTSSGTFPNTIFQITFVGLGGPLNLVSVLNNTSLFGSNTIHGFSFNVTRIQAGGVGVDEIQQIELIAATDPRSYTLSWTDIKGQFFVTGMLPYNATQSQVQTALRALYPLQNVTVSTVGNSPYLAHTVTFVGFTGIFSGSVAANDLPPLQVAVYPTAASGTLWQTGLPSNAIIVSYQVQIIVSGNPPATGGTFGIAFADAISNTTNTATIAYNANASTLQSALNGLTGLTAAVSIYGSPSNCLYIVAVSNVSWLSSFTAAVNSLTPSGSVLLTPCGVTQFEKQQIVVSGSPNPAYVPTNGGNIIWSVSWFNGYQETESTSDAPTAAVSLGFTQTNFTAATIIQQINFSGGVLTWVDPFGIHYATTSLSSGASNSTIQSAIEGMGALSGNVAVTGAGSVKTITISGGVAGNVIGGVTLFAPTQFLGPFTSIVTFSGNPPLLGSAGLAAGFQGPTGLITGLDQSGVTNLNGPYLILWDILDVPNSTDEIQQIAISNNPSSGTYTITWQHPVSGALHTTVPLQYNASSGTVEAALQALPGIGAVTVDTTGAGPNYLHQVQFRDFNGPMLSLMTVQNSTNTGHFNVTLVRAGVAAIAPTVVATFNPWTDPRNRADLIGQSQEFGALCTSNDAPAMFWPHGALAAPKSFAQQSITLTAEITEISENIDTDGPPSLPPESDFKEIVFTASWTDPKGFSSISASIPVDSTASAIQGIVQSLSPMLSSTTITGTPVFMSAYDVSFAMNTIPSSPGSYFVVAVVTPPAGANATVVFLGGAGPSLGISISPTDTTAYPNSGDFMGTVVFQLWHDTLPSPTLSATSSAVSLLAGASAFQSAIQSLGVETASIIVSQSGVGASTAQYGVDMTLALTVTFAQKFLVNPLIFSESYPQSVTLSAGIFEGWSGFVSSSGSVTQEAAELSSVPFGYLKCSGSTAANRAVTNTFSFKWCDCLPSRTFVSVSGGFTSSQLLLDSGSAPIVTTKTGVAAGNLGCIGSDGSIYITGSATANKTPPVQVITMALTPISGSFMLRWVSPSSGTLTTAPIAWNASASDVQKAMQDANFGNVLVIQRSGTSPNSIFVVFFNGYLGQTLNAMTVINNMSNGVAYSATISKVRAYQDSQQFVFITGSPTGGTYTISWVDPGGSTKTTAPIAWNAQAVDVQAAINAIAELASVTVSQFGTAPNYTFVLTFVGLGPVNLVTAASSLTGGTSPSVGTQMEVAGFWDQQLASMSGECVNPGGTFTLSWKNPSGVTHTTSVLPWNASQAAIQAALRAIPGLSTVTVAANLSGSAVSSLTNIYGESVSATGVLQFSSSFITVNFIGIPGTLNNISFNNSTTGQPQIVIGSTVWAASILKIDTSFNVLWAAATQYTPVGLVIQPGDPTLFVLEQFQAFGSSTIKNVFIDGYDSGSGSLLPARVTTCISITENTESGASPPPPAGQLIVPVPVESGSGRNALVA